MKHCTFYLKNMVCTRCITVVKHEMERLGVEIVSISLTKMNVRFDPGQVGTNQIREGLEKHDLGIVESKEEKTVAGIKTMLRELIYSNGEKLPKKVSQLIAQRYGQNYSHLSRLFTRHENITIEKYLILLKVEKAKELLENGEKSVVDITEALGYSSTQHLSRQFKTITGISISSYKKFLQAQRVSPDKL